MMDPENVRKVATANFKKIAKKKTKKKQYHITRTQRIHN